MLAYLQSVPETAEQWAIWSYQNYDCVNQIRQAIKAQKVMQVFQSAGVIAQTMNKPDVLDNLDADKALQIIIDAGGAPEEILVDPKQRDAIRQQRMKQMQQQIALQEAQAGADAMHKLGKVSTDPENPNVASDALKAMGGEEEKK